MVLSELVEGSTDWRVSLKPSKETTNFDSLTGMNFRMTLETFSDEDWNLKRCKSPTGRRGFHMDDSAQFGNNEKVM